MNVYVLGLASHPPTVEESGLRLEEMAYHTSRAALDAAGVSRRQLDSLTIGACDELDGRPISSMLMTAPAGGYGLDEIKVTNSGMSALGLAYARLLSGQSQLGLVASWCKSSKIDPKLVMRLRAEPFFSRPIGIGENVADALFAQAAGAEFSIDEAEVNHRTVAAYQRAALNPRAIGHPVPTIDVLRASSYEAIPIREAHRAPLTDGAVSLVLASSTFVDRNPDCSPLARLSSVAWSTGSFRLDRERLIGMQPARTAWSSALRHAGLSRASDLDVVELDTPTAFHEAAYVRAFGIEREEALSPSGGAFAHNPSFCAGLIGFVEATLQVSGQAGPIQVQGARRAAAHGGFGRAHQGHVVAVLEAVANG
jgi:acetyl-CoA acetyltransferase